jgi:predicted transcriptional regulator
MAIYLPDLRYVRKSPGEIAVLRQLVSLQRCKIINPSEFWLAQMTNQSESSVRRTLVKLAKAGLMSYKKHKQDFRGPNRPTNSYSLNFDKIQRFIDAGKVVVAKALNTYYDNRGVPKHGRKIPVKLTGYTTGQIDPQDVSLSTEYLPLDEEEEVTYNMEDISKQECNLIDDFGILNWPSSAV